MTYVQCPKCREQTPVNISKAVDEHGEVFSCIHCGFHFRYALK